MNRGLEIEPWITDADSARAGLAGIWLIAVLMLTTACPKPEAPDDEYPDEIEVLGSFGTVPAGITGERGIALDLSDLVGATRMRFSERPADLEAVEWEPFESTVEWLLSSGDGTKTIDGELANEHGGYLRVEASIRLAEEPPGGSFTINGDSSFTDSSEVELEFEGIRGAEMMRFALDAAALSDEEWIDFAQRLGFTIGSEEGLYTVYGEFKDSLERTHETSASITLMAAAPGGSFTIDGGATHTNAPDSMVVLDFSGIRGAIELRVANESEDLEDKDFQEMTTTMAWELSPGEGHKTVRAEFLSPFGMTNVSSAQIVYDVTPPAEPSITGPERTGNRSPTWVFDSEGASRFRVQLGSSGETVETQESSFTPPDPFGACNRDFGLTVAAGDEAGNWSAEVVATVHVYCVVSGTVSLHDSSAGDLFIVLLDEQEYETGEVDEESDRWLVIPASEARFRFEDVPDGEWIILGFQDNDGNGELTLGLFGAPVEPWGTYEGESYASLISFAQGHFVIAGDGRSGIVLRLSGFKL